jgi:hypothetical protein
LARYPELPEHIRAALEKIEPSRDGDLVYFPCRVTLQDGRVLDTVYIEPEKPYLRQWGVYPEDDQGKSSIKIEEVVKVEDSPTRLPPRFANEIYLNGESGMGYTIFTVVFSDGTLPTLLGNPFGITTFPRPRLLAYFKVQKHERPNRRQLDLKGVVTQVLGPKCNERSSTLTPEQAWFPCISEKRRDCALTCYRHSRIVSAQINEH